MKMKLKENKEEIKGEENDFQMRKLNRNLKKRNKNKR